MAVTLPIRIVIDLALGFFGTRAVHITQQNAQVGKHLGRR
jgi:hypothetical protein